MMPMPVSMEPTSARQIAEAIRDAKRVIAVGAGTKPALSAVPAERISTRGLTGIVEYDPTEFTFTALAGTPLKEIAQVLSERGQYLPFDPLLTDAGATLGGAIASGLSGPGRFRFGGIRDFILGVQFVDGMGRLLRMGGKVVKNAAGFDVPKFLTGSLGRFGCITEATFKVFPRPASYLTLRLEIPDMESAAGVMTAADRGRWELDALDILPQNQALALRLAGPASAISALGIEILSRWPGKIMAEDAAEELWQNLREFRWVESDSILVKVPITPSDLVSFARALKSIKGVRAHFSAGGNVAFVSIPATPSEESAGMPRTPNAVAISQESVERRASVWSAAHSAAFPLSRLDGVLRDLGLQGMMIRGPGPLWLGLKKNWEISRAVKRALDPENRYPSLEE